MLDIGWTELAIVALIALLVVGPKDLPKAIKTVAGWIGRLRGMAREFQSGVDEMVRESELSEVKDEFDRMANADMDGIMENTIDPGGSVKDSLDFDPDFVPPDETPPKTKPKRKPASKPRGTSSKPGATKPRATKAGTTKATPAKTSAAKARTSKGATATTTPKKPATTRKPAAAKTKGTGQAATKSPKAKSGAGA